MRQTTTLFFFWLIFSWANAQKIALLDADSGYPVANAAVYNKTKTKTAISDLDGVCDLATFESTETIFISHLSYELVRTTKKKIGTNGNKVYLDLRPEQLNEVVMSISKWQQQRKDVPQKIENIDAQSIAFANPQTSADLLQQSGKVFVQKSQLGGGSPMIRGFATNRVLLSVDGVRMNNAIFRGGNVQNVISIDPFTIKNTEVLFGPGSVIYGSDAIGGVMNFYTKDARFSFTDSLMVTGKVDYRFSTANFENTVHVGLNLGHQTWGSYTSVSYNSFDDLVMGSNGPDAYLRPFFATRRHGEDILVENDNPRKQVASGYQQINLLQKFKYKPNNNWQYDIGLHFSETSDYPRYDRLIRPDGSADGLRSAEWFYGPQKWFMANAQITKKGKNKFYDAVKLTTAYQFFEESRNNRDFGDEIRNTNVENVNALSVNLDFENKRIGDLRMYYGVEYLYNKVGSIGSFLNIVSLESGAIATRYPDGSTWQTFAGHWNAEYRLKPNFSLLSGLRYSQVWVDANFDNTFYQFPFQEADLITGALTGSLGFSWFPKENLQMTLNGSTGFRAPNIDDVGKVFDSEPGSVVVPNPDLEPEYAYNVDFGIRKNFDDRLILKAATYYTYLVDALVRRGFQLNGQNQIEYQGELSNVQAIQNAAKAYVYGFEFGIEAFMNQHWSIVGNLTLTQGVEEDDSGIDTPVRHAPPTFADAHLIFKKNRFKADFFLNYNGEIAADNLTLSERSKTFIYELDENGNPFSPSWYTLNFRSNFHVSNSFDVNLALENFTDRRYRTYSSGIAAPGFNLILGLGFTF